MMSLPANLAAETAILGAILLDNRHYQAASCQVESTTFLSIRIGVCFCVSVSW
jgi:replicative DNA helicase